MTERSAGRQNFDREIAGRLTGGEIITRKIIVEALTKHGLSPNSVTNILWAGGTRFKAETGANRGIYMRVAYFYFGDPQKDEALRDEIEKFKGQVRKEKRHLAGQLTPRRLQLRLDGGS